MNTDQHGNTAEDLTRIASHYLDCALTARDDGNDPHARFCLDDAKQAIRNAQELRRRDRDSMPRMVVTHVGRLYQDGEIGYEEIRPLALGIADRASIDRGAVLDALAIASIEGRWVQ